MLATDETTTFEHEIGTAGSLRLETLDTEIRLRGVEGDVVRLRLAAGDLQAEFRIDATEGRLDVRPVRRWVFGPRRDVGPLEVEVPRGAHVRARTASGSILALDLLAGLKAKSAAGAIDLAGLAGEVSAETISGAIRLRAEALGHLALKTVSGGIDTTVSSLGSLAAHSISGSIRIAGRLADDGTHGVETVSGGVTVATDGPVQLRASTVSGLVRTDQESIGGGAGRRILAVGGHGPVIDVRTVSGSIRLSRWEPDPTGGAAGAAASVAVPTTLPSASTAVPDPAVGPAEPSVDPVPAGPDEDPRMPILRALQRGEIDVAEAERRLSALESSSARGVSESTDA
jgi:hypothetical protein